MVVRGARVSKSKYALAKRKMIIKERNSSRPVREHGRALAGESKFPPGVVGGDEQPPLPVTGGNRDRRPPERKAVSPGQMASCEGNLIPE